MRIIVIGAGVSATHAALTLLERGYPVELWDVGREEARIPEAGTDFHGLKDRLPDATTYFYGSDLHALIPPTAPEMLRYPPSRHFLASTGDPLWSFVSDNFAPYVSYAKGGLANGWGANALSFDDDDLAHWPISFADMEAAYRIVYQRVPVAGPAFDDLTPHFPGVCSSQPPVRLTEADKALVQAYVRKRPALARRGIKLGQARLAVVTDPQREEACNYCDRCLWGCPRASIYNPGLSTLEACRRKPGFRYRPGRLVVSLVASDMRISGVRYLDTDTQELREEACDVVFLAAGALETGSILLRTVSAARLDLSLETEGLLDTSVVKLPFVALRRIGQPAEPSAFQFNRLIMGVENEAQGWPRYLHGEVLHLTSLIYHPLIERMPFDSRLSLKLFFALRSALGVVSLFFPDQISSANRQILIEPHQPRGKVELKYQEPNQKEAYIQRSLAKVRSAIWQLGCLPTSAVRSATGAGIHYAGTVPMGQGPKRCDVNGRSNLFPNLYIADGAAFPALPSKSITMSLAAHATRVASNARL
jgi:choline dehydrogenase-like flavoprotein